MHGIQIGNSLVGYGAGARQGEGSAIPGEPGTLEESHRQCTGRGGGEEEGRENILFRLQGRELLEAEQSQVFKSAPSPQGGQ